MKKWLFLIPAFCLASFWLKAQFTSVSLSAGSAAVAVVVNQASSCARTLDPVVVKRRLLVAPRDVFVTAAPQAAVKTTETTTVVTTPPHAGRVYNSVRSVVLVEDHGQSRTLPYVTLPVLFVNETAELLRDDSRSALQDVAAVILVVSKIEPGAIYDIESHTGTDGTNDFNLSLSAERAQRVFEELTQRYGVPARVLSAHGYGGSFPIYPRGTEAQKYLDRRVLVVRTK